MTSGATIRLATLADAPALLAIYAPYVQNTAITLNMRCRLWRNLKIACVIQ